MIATTLPEFGEKKAFNFVLVLLFGSANPKSSLFLARWGASRPRADFLELQVEQAEKRLQTMMGDVSGAGLLKTLPTVEPILSAVLALEIGDVLRFPSAEHLASYASLVPRVSSSAGRPRMGQVGGNVNRMLKWAFGEATNLLVLQQRRRGHTHALRLYQRIRSRKNLQKAVVAVGRHFAEAAYWVLWKKAAYREPRTRSLAVSSTHG